MDELRFVESRPMNNGNGIFIKTSDGRWARFYNNGDIRVGLENHVASAVAGKPWTKGPPFGNHVVIKFKPMS
jgi:hypothetical protein